MERFLQIFRIPDLRKKVFIVVGLLVAFRLFAAIPIPGVDAAALENFFRERQFFGFLNIISGGGLSNLSVAMLGVGPYITATIIMQLLTVIFPSLKKAYFEEGAQGYAKFNRLSRYLTVPLAALQGYGFLALLTTQGVIAPQGAFQTLTNVLVITAGSMIVLWLGELISEQKIGNGVSLIIFAGIVSRWPTSLAQALIAYNPGLLMTYIGFVIVAILLIGAIVYLNEGERKVPVAYARRVRGTKLYGGASSYLPLKVNQAGMIPLIFAISVLLFPQFFAQIIAAISPDVGAKISDFVNGFFNNGIVYGISYFFLVFIFTYFYTSITFDPEEIAKNLQRAGGFIPGIRPGTATAQFIKRTLGKLTFLGAVFLGLIAVAPLVVQAFTGLQFLRLSGASLLIVVAVALETMRQIDAQLTMREYEGFHMR
ncbi:preprotein translocase subunit SecY [Candidatus Parcubacteria bacterium]|nr:MAG: preprotein translocase subunit SecY [Candidatus Parcubacteria bacterium]